MAAGWISSYRMGISWSKTRGWHSDSSWRLLDAYEDVWPPSLRGSRCKNCGILIVVDHRIPYGTWMKCPHCGAGYHYNLENHEGSFIQCQNCAKEIPIPEVLDSEMS
jgi:hypothetical protein